MEKLRQSVFKSDTGTIDGMWCSSSSCLNILLIVNHHATLMVVDVEPLMSPIGAYGKFLMNVHSLQSRLRDYSGSYSGAGFLVSTLADSSYSTISDYGRFLDLDIGVAKTVWAQHGFQYSRLVLGTDIMNVLI